MSSHRRETAVFIALALFIPLVSSLRGITAMFEGELPPGWSGDGHGHLYKIWKIYEDGWRPWIEDWYNGYPFLRYYPPLSYLVAAVFSHLAGPYTAYKLVVVLDIVLAGVSSMFMGRTLGLSWPSSLVVATSYASSPWLYRMVAPEGAFPRAFAYAIAPLAVALLIRLFRKPNAVNAVLSGISWGALILSHHTLTFVTLVAALPIALTAAKPRSISVVPWLAASSGVAMGVALFWLVPFLADMRMAHFRPENNIDYLFRFFSVEPQSMFEVRGDGWDNYQGWTRVLVPLIGLILGIYGGRWRAMGALLIMLPVLSLGAYGPLPWLNRLPLLEAVPPYRWLDAYQLVAAMALGVFSESLTLKVSGRRVAGYVLTAALLALLVLEPQQKLAVWKGTELAQDLVDALRYMSNDPEVGWRFYQWGMALVVGSTVAYSPAIAGRPTVDGWYRQGDVLYPLHGELGYAVGNDPEYARNLIDVLGIKYVVLHEGHAEFGRARENLERAGLIHVFSRGPIHVYKNPNASPVRTKGNVTVNVVEWTDGYIALEYRSYGPAEVGLAEAWFPYWNMYINGMGPLPVARDPNGLVTLYVPPGSGRIELRFEDPYIALRVVSAAFLAAVIGLLALGVRGRARSGVK